MQDQAQENKENEGKGEGGKKMRPISKKQSEDNKRKEMLMFPKKEDDSGEDHCFYIDVLEDILISESMDNLFYSQMENLIYEFVSKHDQGSQSHKSDLNRQTVFHFKICQFIKKISLVIVRFFEKNICE